MKRQNNQRDPIRNFRGTTLATLLEEASYRCSHPLCDFNDLPLEAHHIIEHAQGGLTVINNGIILCSDCHELTHKGCLPLSLLLSFKHELKEAKERLFTELIPLTSDELLFRVTEVAKKSASPHEKLTELNHLIIAANFVKNAPFRFLIFSEALLAKAAVLSDNIPEVGKTPQKASEGLFWRRQKACLLGTYAAYLARRVDAHAQFVRGLHYKAIGYRARGKYLPAIETYRAILKYIQFWKESSLLRYHLYSTESRMWSELAVNRSQLSKYSQKAEKDALTGIGLSNNSFDYYHAQIRLAQTYLDQGNYSECGKYLNKFSGEKNEFNHELQALLLRIQAKFVLKTGHSVQKVFDLLKQGISLSTTHKLFHQEYQFWLLEKSLLPELAIH